MRIASTHIKNELAELMATLLPRSQGGREFWDSSKVVRRQRFAGGVSFGVSRSEHALPSGPLALPLPAEPGTGSAWPSGLAKMAAQETQKCDSVRTFGLC